MYRKVRRGQGRSAGVADKALLKGRKNKVMPDAVRIARLGMSKLTCFSLCRHNCQHVAGISFPHGVMKIAH